MWVAFPNAKATHIFFSKNISIYAIFYDQSFNDTLTNDVVSFEQLGPELLYTVVMTLLTQGPVSKMFWKDWSLVKQGTYTRKEVIWETRYSDPHSRLLMKPICPTLASWPWKLDNKAVFSFMCSLLWRIILYMISFVFTTTGLSAVWRP